MTFVLTEIRTFDNVRRYYLDVVEEDRGPATGHCRRGPGFDSKVPNTSAELPLLCRRLLEGHTEIETMVFTKTDMERYASERTAEANALLQRRKARRPQVSNRVGQAWRGSPAPVQDR